MATGRAAALLAVALVLLGASACRPEASPWRPRHVVMVALDTCRADHLGCYGHDRDTTPNIDRLAAAGVVFRKAFSQSNESLFSYSSLFTGLHPRQLGALSPDFTLPRELPTLASLLRGAGFRTAAFVAGGHLRSRFGFSRGFEVYRDEWDFGSLFHTVPPAMEWLQGVVEDPRASSFLFIQGYDLHGPYAKPLGFENLYDPGYEGLGRWVVTAPAGVELVYHSRLYPPQVAMPATGPGSARSRPDVMRNLPALERLGFPARPLSEADVDHVVAAYDGALAYADAWVGLLMARIRELGIADETLVVLYGDHGEDLRPQDYLAHRVLLLDSSVHVPLVFWGGGLEGGRSVDRVVELRALRETLLALAGQEAGGASLLPDLEGRGPGVGGLALSEGVQPRWSLRDERYRLVCDARSDAVDEVLALPLEADRFALYDPTSDPSETKNLLADPSRREEAVRQAARLRAVWAAGQGAVRPQAEASPGRPGP